MEVLFFVAGLAAGIGGGFLLRKTTEERAMSDARARSEALLRDATAEGEQRKRELLTEAREENLRLRQEIDKEVKDRRNEMQRAERRLEQKEENLDRKLDALGRREEELKAGQEALKRRMEDVDSLYVEQARKLEEVAAMTREEAQQILLAAVEEEANHRIGVRLRELEEKAKREADRKAQEIIATAIQRTCVEHTSEAAVSVVPLPSDEMKGRIIGREGVAAEVAVTEYEAASYTGYPCRLRQYFPAWVLPENHPFIGRASQALEGVLGGRPRLTSWGFSTDGVYTAGMAGIPTLGFGPGEERYAHTSEEQIALADVATAARGYAAIAAELLG